MTFTNTYITYIVIVDKKSQRFPSDHKGSSRAQPSQSKVVK